MKKELRYFKAELRVSSEGDAPKKICGYAARFNEFSEMMGWFREKIAPGAFAEALKSSDARALFNHDPNHVLGRESAGTLSLREDDAGLFYEITPPDTQWARDLVASIERGDIKESSFAFSMAGGIEEWVDSVEPRVRTLHRIGELFDVSPVTYPAYPGATSGIRSLEDILKDHEEDRKKQRNRDDVPGFFIGIERARLDLAEIE